MNCEICGRTYSTDQMATPKVCEGCAEYDLTADFEPTEIPHFSTWEAEARALRTENTRLRETLKKLEYWFDTDAEILDAMDHDTRADHDRQHARIKAAIGKSK